MALQRARAPRPWEELSAHALPPSPLGVRAPPQGAKLQYGHVPLYESGDNPNAKQFQSLHAVQASPAGTCTRSLRCPRLARWLPKSAAPAGQRTA